jgi:hypothetical protein
MNFGLPLPVSYHGSIKAFCQKLLSFSSFISVKVELNNFKLFLFLSKLIVERSIPLKGSFHSLSFVFQRDFREESNLKFFVFSLYSQIAFSGSSHKSIAIRFQIKGSFRIVSIILSENFHKTGLLDIAYNLSQIPTHKSSFLDKVIIFSLDFNIYSVNFVVSKGTSFLLVLLGSISETFRFSTHISIAVGLLNQSE